MRNQNKTSQSGFTIIELLVVTAIMAIIATIGIVNWNTERSTRTLTIAQNEMITNIHKVQSYAVSSKNTPTGESAKFYIIQFKTGEQGYTIKAATGTDYTVVSVEKLAFPDNINLSAITLASNGAGPDGGEALNPSCIDIIFSATYGKTYFTSATDTCDDAAVSTILKNFPVLSPKSNYDVVFTYDYRGVNRYAKIYGSNGKVETFTTDPNALQQLDTGQGGMTRGGQAL